MKTLAGLTLEGGPTGPETVGKDGLPGPRSWCGGPPSTSAVMS